MELENGNTLKKDPSGRRTAKDLVKTIKKIKDKNEKSAYEVLKAQCADSVKEMVKNGQFSTEVELDSTEGLSLFTEDLIELGYKYCLIEKENEKGEILGHRLRISVKHLK